MTPKEIAADIIEQENVYLVPAIQLAQAYLALLERVEKLERVAEAARRITQPVDWANYDKRVALVKAVDDLEQE